MTVTKYEALMEDEFHYTGKHECTRTVGPRGGIRENITRCRRTGQTQTWKTRPNDFRTPIKHGMYDSGSINEYNAQHFHVASKCPLDDTKQEIPGEVTDPWQTSGPNEPASKGSN